MLKDIETKKPSGTGEPSDKFRYEILAEGSSSSTITILETMVTSPETSNVTRTKVKARRSPLPDNMEEKDVLLNPISGNNSQSLQPKIDHSTQKLVGILIKDKKKKKTKSMRKKTLKADIAARGESFNPRKWN